MSKTSRSGAARRRTGPDGPLHLFGLHTVRAALDNPRRRKHLLMATPNATRRLLESGPPPEVECRPATPRELDRLLGAEAVHQGVALSVDPLPRRGLADLDAAHLVVMLDQVTDPHNVGAILRTACAFGADALLTTARFAPRETGVLAKAASGALDLMDFVEVGNLAAAIEALQRLGFHCMGLDSEAGEKLAPGRPDKRVAIVLGAEGRGLRQKTRGLVDRMVRLDLPGSIRSLNVSNAAAIALYAVTAPDGDTE